MDMPNRPGSHLLVLSEDGAGAAAQPVIVHDVVVDQQGGVDDLQGRRGPRHGSGRRAARVHLVAQEEQPAAHHLSPGGKGAKTRAGVRSPGVYAAEIRTPLFEQAAQLTRYKGLFLREPVSHSPP